MDAFLAIYRDPCFLLFGVVGQAIGSVAFFAFAVPMTVLVARGVDGARR